MATRFSWAGTPYHLRSNSKTCISFPIPQAGMPNHSLAAGRWFHLRHPLGVQARLAGLFFTKVHMLVDLGQRQPLSCYVPKASNNQVSEVTHARTHHNSKFALMFEPG